MLFLLYAPLFLSTIFFFFVRFFPFFLFGCAFVRPVLFIIRSFACFILFMLSLSLCSSIFIILSAINITVSHSCSPFLVYFLRLGLSVVCEKKWWCRLAFSVLFGGGNGDRAACGSVCIAVAIKSYACSSSSFDFFFPHSLHSLSMKMLWIYCMHFPY